MPIRVATLADLGTKHRVRMSARQDVLAGRASVPRAGDRAGAPR